MLAAVFARMCSLRHAAGPVRGSLAFAPMHRGVVAVLHATEPEGPEALELAFFKGGNLDEAGKPAHPDGVPICAGAGVRHRQGALLGRESLSAGGICYR